MPWGLGLLLLLLLVAPAGPARRGSHRRLRSRVQLGRLGRPRASLSDLVGKRGVVLAWFPKAFTAG